MAEKVGQQPEEEKPADVPMVVEEPTSPKAADPEILDEVKSPEKMEEVALGHPWI